MKKQLVWFLVAMFLLVCGGVAADAPPAKFDGSTIHPYTNAWKFSVTPPDGITREQGIWSDQVEAVGTEAALMVVPVCRSAKLPAWKI